MKEIEEKIKKAYEEKKEKDRKGVTNHVLIAGCIVGDPVESKRNKNMLQFMLSTKRLSDVADVIPVLVKKKDVEGMDLRDGMFVSIEGMYQSYNESGEDGKRHLRLNVVPDSIEIMEEETYKNEIFLDGFVCKDITLRDTPKGKTIADVMFATNRPNGTSDYIPLIFWNRNARYVNKKAHVGSNLRCDGRIQSREYGEGNITYEVSVAKVEIA